jgi:hypothetical protein
MLLDHHVPGGILIAGTFAPGRKSLESEAVKFGYELHVTRIR